MREILQRYILDCLRVLYVEFHDYMPMTLSSQIYKAALEAKDSTWNLFYSSAENNVLH